ncbi:MAG: heavy metal-associated domain-containing protein [Ignavibacteriota bacterium]
MTNTYNVQGMTSDGCANGVYKLLSKLEGVIGVGVDWQTQKAVIDSTYRINLLILQDALFGAHYLITEQAAVPRLTN